MNCQYEKLIIFQCLNESKTISFLRVCDFTKDCKMGNDEEFCQRSECTKNEM